MQRYKTFRHMQEKIQKISPIKQRILQFIDTLGISKRDFYAKTGISRGTLESATGITEDTIAKVFATYSNLSQSWIFLNQGEMLINQNKEEINAHLNAHPNAHLSDKNDNSLGDKKYQTEYSDAPLSIVRGPESSPYETKREVKVQISKEQLRMPDFLQQRSKTSVPFYNLPVSAGQLGVLESEVFPQNAPDGFLELSAFSGCEAVFPIIGVSMEPIISSGDWIGIRSIDNISRSWDFIQTNVIYLIITREDRMIKFIDKATDEDFIICRSANASPFKVYKGDILKLYRVKACVKDL